MLTLLDRPGASREWGLSPVLPHGFFNLPEFELSSQKKIFLRPFATLCDNNRVFRFNLSYRRFTCYWNWMQASVKIIKSDHCSYTLQALMIYCLFKHPIDLIVSRWWLSPQKTLKCGDHTLFYSINDDTDTVDLSFNIKIGRVCR